MMAKKSSQCFLSKKPNFKVISTQKHTTNIIDTPINQYINSKHLKRVKKHEIKVG
jgi:hypothetical protein